jgi:Tol biopolymer transport system component
MSPNGRYVVIASSATNLVRGDNNGNLEFYVKDTESNGIRKVSVADDGGELNDIVNFADVSANGRYVAFQTSASNVVPGDTNGRPDIFVRDLWAGVNERVSVGRNGAGSGDGIKPSISDDGRRGAFASESPDLVPNDTNKTQDIFVRNLRRGTTTRVSVGPNGLQSELATRTPQQFFDDGRESFDPQISGDGKSVAFASYSRNLVPDDTNNSGDVFLHTLRTGTTERISLADGGVQATGHLKGSGSWGPSISADGTVVAFSSNAGNLVPRDPGAPSRIHQLDSYVYNRKTKVTQLVEVNLNGGRSESGAREASISPDGRFVSFSSSDDNIIAGDTPRTTDVFVRNLRTGNYRFASVNSRGRQANGSSNGSEISWGGRRVAFTSDATNLVRRDTNGVADVFVHKFW